MNKLLLIAGVIAGVALGVILYKRNRKRAQDKTKELVQEPRLVHAESQKQESCVQDEARAQSSALPHADDIRRQTDLEVASAEPTEDQQPLDLHQRVIETPGADEARSETSEIQSKDPASPAAEELSEAVQHDGQSGAGIYHPPIAEPRTTRLEPERRGGRPRTTRPQGKVPLPGSKSVQLRPEVICFESNRQWMLAVEAVGDSVPATGVVVSQNGLHLEEDDEGRWSLGQAFGRVVVRSDQDQLVKEIDLGEDRKNYLLFKVTGKRGRRLKYLSAGAHLVVVPNESTPLGAFYGSPEPVSLVGYRGYYCVVDRDTQERLAFLTEEGQRIVIQSTASRFELVGNRLSDASEDVGPLFGSGPPRIAAIDGHVWENIGRVVVGQEGRGQGRWRKAFNPVPNMSEQNLPAEVHAKKGGWYFLRFYDKRDDLVESLDFRFVRSLKEIKVVQQGPMPPESGHEVAQIAFIHDPGCIIRSAGQRALNITIQSEPGSTNVTIPADPAFDQTYWEVAEPPSARVDIQVLVERVWWGLTDESELKTPTEMTDKTLSVTRDAFAATSNSILQIWFPRPRWAHYVLVGFDISKRRKYRVEVTKRHVSIPLRELFSEQIEDRTQLAELKLWLSEEGSIGPGVVVCWVAADANRLDTTVEQADIRIHGEIELTVQAPDQMASCSTCDHAKRRPDRVFSFKCMRHHWATVSLESFRERFSHYTCPEWQGEYYDADGHYYQK